MLKTLALFLGMLVGCNFAFAQQLLKNGDDNWIQEFPDGSFRVLNLEHSSDLSLLEKFLTTDPSFNFLPSAEDNFYYIKSYIFSEVCKAQLAISQLSYNEAVKNCLIIDDELNKAQQEQNLKDISHIQAIKVVTFRDCNAAKSDLQSKVEECGTLNNLLNFSPEKRKRLMRKKYKVTYTKPTGPLVPSDLVQSSSARTVDSGRNAVASPQPDHAKIQTYPLPNFVHADLSSVPPFKSYKLVFDGVDSFTKNQRRELEKDLLFSFTEENLRSFQKGRDFIVCMANVARYPGYAALNMEININAINTATQFGSLEKGSYLLLKLINGENLRLMCNHTDKGTVDQLDGTTTYRTQFVIDSNAEAKLKKYEVDKLRLIWSTGFDEFDIVNMDFFINQIKSFE